MAVIPPLLTASWLLFAKLKTTPFFSNRLSTDDSTLLRSSSSTKIGIFFSSSAVNITWSPFTRYFNLILFSATSGFFVLVIDGLVVGVGVGTSVGRTVPFPMDSMPFFMDLINVPALSTFIVGSTTKGAKITEVPDIGTVLIEG